MVVIKNDCPSKTTKPDISGATATAAVASRHQHRVAASPRIPRATRVETRRRTNRRQNAVDSRSGRTPAHHHLPIKTVLMTVEKSREIPQKRTIRVDRAPNRPRVEIVDGDRDPNRPIPPTPVAAMPNRRPHGHRRRRHGHRRIRRRRAGIMGPSRGRDRRRTVRAALPRRNLSGLFI